MAIDILPKTEELMKGRAAPAMMQRIANVRQTALSSSDQ